MKTRTLKSDLFILTLLLFIYIFLFSCRSFEPHPQCREDAPCLNHEGQIYCVADEHHKWACCQCSKR